MNNINNTIGPNIVIDIDLNKFYDNLYCCFSPVFGAVEFVKKKRMYATIKKDIDTLVQYREEFLNYIIEDLPKQDTPEAYKKACNEIDKIKELPNFKDSFDKINRIYNRLNQKDKNNLTIECIKNMSDNISFIQKELLTNFLYLPNTENNLILYQALDCIQYILDKSNESIRQNDIENLNAYLFISLIFTTKLIAINYNKLKYEDLYPTIAYVVSLKIIEEESRKNNPRKKTLNCKIDERVFSILG